MSLSHPRDSIPVSWHLLSWALTQLLKNKSLGLKCLLHFPCHKEALEKFKQDFKNSNLSLSNLLSPAFEVKMQDLNRDFANIAISPWSWAALCEKVPLHRVKEFEHQARQNICTFNFSTAFNYVISDCNLIWKTAGTTFRPLSSEVRTKFKK